jgi:hypothetical protein
MWAFSTMLICMAIAIGMNETVANGHGKAIFFALFMTAFIAKISQKFIRERRIKVFLMGVLAFHVILVFVIPNDGRYPGGLLFPAGILDIIVMYFLFQRVARSI